MGLLEGTRWVYTIQVVEAKLTLYAAPRTLYVRKILLFTERCITHLHVPQVSVGFNVSSFLMCLGSIRGYRPGLKSTDNCHTQVLIAFVVQWSVSFSLPLLDIVLTRTNVGKQSASSHNACTSVSFFVIASTSCSRPFRSRAFAIHTRTVFTHGSRNVSCEVHVDAGSRLPP